jgi:hypothetical protein
LKDKDFLNEVFKDTMGGFDLNQFTKEWKKNIKNKDVENIQYLEVYRDIKLNDITGVITLDITNVFEGITKMDNSIKESVPLDFIAINDLKKLPLKLNDEFIIPGHIIENVNLITSTKGMTLFEVIETILYDITFYGDPSSRDKIKEDVMSVNNKDNMIQLLTIDMEDMVSDERYEEAIELLSLIKKYKKTSVDEIEFD